MTELNDGEIWINKLGEIVVLKCADILTRHRKYPYECFSYTSKEFMFSVSSTGKYNVNYVTDSDLVKKITPEDNPEYFL